MSIQVACNCGTILKVRDELAGKRVKCPKCDSVVQVAKLDSIRVKCSCGQLLNAKPSLAGKQVLCPACRQPMTVSSGAQQPSDAPDVGFGSALSDALAAAPPASTQGANGNDFWNKASIAPTSAPAKKKKGSGSGSQDALVVFTAILCILFGLWHIGNLLQILLLIGSAHLASLGGAVFLVKLALSVGILAVGIGLLAKQDWAKELGPLVAYGYLVMLGISAILMLFSAALFGSGGLLLIVFAIPILGIHAIVPSLLLHVCQQN